MISPSSEDQLDYIRHKINDRRPEASGGDDFASLCFKGAFRISGYYRVRAYEGVRLSFKSLEDWEDARIKTEREFWPAWQSCEVMTPSEEVPLIVRMAEARNPVNCAHPFALLSNPREQNLLRSAQEGTAFAKRMFSIVGRIREIDCSVDDAMISLLASLPSRIDAAGSEGHSRGTGWLEQAGELLPQLTNIVQERIGEKTGELPRYPHGIARYMELVTASFYANALFCMVGDPSIVITDTAPFVDRIYKSLAAVRGEDPSYIAVTSKLSELPIPKSLLARWGII